MSVLDPVPMDPAQYVAAADAAVDAAARWLAAAAPGEYRQQNKASGEEVTAADLAVHAVIGAALADSTPGIPMVGEESPGGADLLARCWLLDPIDGTINIARGAPYYAVSLALLDGWEPVLGVVYAPAIGARATAVRGGRLPRTAELPVELRRSIVGLTGGGARKVGGGPDLVAALFRHSRRLRMHGSMALDLYGAAAGWLDACVCVRPRPWDVAAGVVLARAAGLAVLGADGQPYTWDAPILVAASPRVAVELVELVGTALA